jgi:hypothetical protein
MKIKMSKLEQAKEELRLALARIEDVVSRRIEELQAENGALRTEIIKLKQKAPATKRKAAASTDKMDLLQEINLVNRQVANDVDLTLSELKKLVRQD